ncbi:MAG: KH domain-containing protein [Candidatus Saccharibacteria bacterium]
MAEKDQEFLEYVVGAIVDRPDDIVINRTVDERGVLLELTVSPDDMGKIIGKAGATAKAIRTLLRVMGAKHDARFNLKIIEPEGEDRPAVAPPETQQPEVDTSIDNVSSKAREGMEDLDIDI